MREIFGPIIQQKCYFKTKAVSYVPSTFKENLKFGLYVSQRTGLEWIFFLLRGAESLLNQGIEWEKKGEYNRAIDMYTKITPNMTTDHDLVEGAMVKVGTSYIAPMKLAHYLIFKTWSNLGKMLSPCWAIFLFLLVVMSNPAFRLVLAICRPEKMYLLRKRKKWNCCCC